MQGCCGLGLARSLLWQDPWILCLWDALLHIVQGTAGKSPLGEVNAAQVQGLWGCRVGDAVAHLSNEPSLGTVSSVGTGSFTSHGTPSCQTHIRGVWADVIRLAAVSGAPQKVFGNFKILRQT